MSESAVQSTDTATNPDLSSLAATLAEGKPAAVPTRKLLANLDQTLAEAFWAGEDIHSLVRRRSEVIDGILRTLWQNRGFGDDQDLALVAVGGYGRGELHPHSDIDLLILIRDEAGDHWQEPLTDFITLLWDLKLDIGHSVRTLADCTQAAKEDVTILTNLLEARLLIGNQELLDTLSDRVYSDEVCSDRDYFLAKREEQRQRHIK